MPTVLILGAASDMAVALARKFASKGYNLQLAARKVDRLATLQTDLSIRSSVPCELIEFDALSFSTHQQFVEQLSALPDFLICVFGLLGEQDKAMEDWAHAEQIIASNYTGAVSVINAFAKAFAKRGSGMIIGISSVAGLRGRQSNYIYGSAKAGFSAYLSGLRNRMYPLGIHVMSVLPGFVNTNMTANLKLPPLLTAQPEEVAEAIYTAVQSKKDVLYVRGIWRWIMMGITSIPEFMFKKLKL